MVGRFQQVNEALRGVVRCCLYAAWIGSEGHAGIIRVMWLRAVQSVPFADSEPESAAILAGRFE